MNQNEDIPRTDYIICAKSRLPDTKEVILTQMHSANAKEVAFYVDDYLFKHPDQIVVVYTKAETYEAVFSVKRVSEKQ